jgi:two-component system chemotaxis response regulator CheY
MAFNILVVDDSRIVRAVMKKTLVIAGVDVGELYEAGNGKEALTILDAKWVDLVLADINMPEMNGIELVETMKRKNLMETIPVVIVSTERSVTRIEELKAKGVREYLSKPFTPESIREVVDKLLGSGESRKVDPSPAGAG